MTEPPDGGQYSHACHRGGHLVLDFGLGLGHGIVQLVPGLLGQLGGRYLVLALGLGGERCGLNLGLGVGIGDNLAQPASAGRGGKEHVLLGRQHGVDRVNEFLFFHCWVGGLDNLVTKLLWAVFIDGLVVTRPVVPALALFPPPRSEGRETPH